MLLACGWCFIAVYDGSLWFVGFMLVLLVVCGVCLLIASVCYIGCVFDCCILICLVIACLRCVGCRLVALLFPVLGLLVYCCCLDVVSWYLLFVWLLRVGFLSVVMLLWVLRFLGCFVYGLWGMRLWVAS